MKSPFDEMLDALTALALEPARSEDNSSEFGGPQNLQEVFDAGRHCFHVHVDREDGRQGCFNVVAANEADARAIIMQVPPLTADYDPTLGYKVSECVDETDDEDWQFTLAIRAVKTVSAENLEYMKRQVAERGDKKEPLSLPAVRDYVM